MAAPISIHRKEDMRCALLLAEQLRLQLSAPAAAVTERVVERLTDMLGEARIDRQNEMARYHAEIVAGCAEVNAEMTRRIWAVFDAATTYVSARKALRRALADRD